MTAIFVSAQHWEDLDPRLQAAVLECASHGRTLFATSLHGGSPPNAGVERVKVNLDRPLELQQEATWLREVDRPVQVALHVLAEPVMISRWIPCVWLATSSRPAPVSSAFALAQRAGLVIGVRALRDYLAIESERFVELSSVVPSDLWGLLHETPVNPPNDTLHVLLTAELFKRHATAESAFQNLTKLTTYRQTGICERISGLSQAELGDEVGGLEDPISAALLYALDPDRHPSPTDVVRRSSLPDFLSLMVGLTQASHLSDLVSHPPVASYSLLKPWTRRLILSYVIQLALDDSPSLGANSKIWELLNHPDTAELVSPDLVAWLGANEATPLGLLERLERSPRRFTALSAKLELMKIRYAGAGWIETSQVESALAEVDSKSWHTGLWTSGLHYWKEMTGRPWAQEMDSPPPPVLTSAQVSSMAINEADTQARAALADHDYERAVELFEKVRALCLAQQPPTRTTELAARLNIGWAKWKAGRPESVWRPYITSVLSEVQPDTELLGLRAGLNDFLTLISTGHNADERYANELAARIWPAGSDHRREAPAIDIVESVIAEIDSRALHGALWHAGLKYWLRMTGEDWCLEPAHASPAIAPRGTDHVDAARVGDLDRRARQALRTKRRRRAAALFQRVRAACESLEPPLRSTEQAARLNLGWTYWSLRKPPEVWQPFITSVLEEVRPPPRLVEVRCQASKLLRTRE